MYDRSVGPDRLVGLLGVLAERHSDSACAGRYRSPYFALMWSRHGGQRVFGDARAVGTHVGDQRHRAFAAQSTPSYSFWATIMVFLAENCRRMLACCCKVLVVNGAGGFSCRSFCSTLVTT